MNSASLWRSRIAYLIVSVTLWVAVWPLKDIPLALRVCLGLAILANVLFLLVTFAVPVDDSFQLGREVGKSVGYHAGYRDGFTQGMQLSTEGAATVAHPGADLIGLPEDSSPISEHRRS